MTTVIWIEPVSHADGRPCYTPRKERLTAAGLQLRTRLGVPEGEILVERTTNSVVTSCRALMTRGVTGGFETRKPGIPYPCMRGDIESTAGLTIREDADPKGKAHPIFTPWQPYNDPRTDGIDGLQRDEAFGGTPSPLKEIA